MGQARFYIELSSQLLFGFDYVHNTCFEFHFAMFIFGMGLDKNAKGFLFQTLFR